jgi:hypothetical protein
MASANRSARAPRLGSVEEFKEAFQHWLHQLGGVTKAPRFDEPTFTAKLKGMLDEMKTSTVNNQANGRARIEF